MVGKHSPCTADGRAEAMTAQHTGCRRLKCAARFPCAQVLKARGVKEDKILFLSMVAAPQAIHRLCGTYPDMKVLTSEVDRGLDEHYRIVPGVGEFGQRYFSD